MDQPSYKIQLSLEKICHISGSLYKSGDDAISVHVFYGNVTYSPPTGPFHSRWWWEVMLGRLSAARPLSTLFITGHELAPDWPVGFVGQLSCVQSHWRATVGGGPWYWPKDICLPHSGLHMESWLLGTHSVHNLIVMHCKPGEAYTRLITAVQFRNSVAQKFLNVVKKRICRSWWGK